MFEALDLNKIMYFKDGSTIVYRQALENLASQIDLSGELNIQKIENKIKTAIANEAIAINREGGNPDHHIVVAFHRWAMSFHTNGVLANPPGQTRPYNIIHDIRMATMNKNNKSAEDTLFYCFMEGLNGRRISNGQTPTTDFIETSLMLQVLNAADAVAKAANVYKDTNTRTKGQGFKSKYSPNPAQAIIIQNITLASQDKGEEGKKRTPLFGFLSSKDVFNFTKTENETTGANAYGLEPAVSKGLDALKAKTPAPTQEEIAEMVKELTTILTSLSEAFGKINNDFDRQVAYWDASEWACRAIVALQIVERLYPTTHKDVAANLMKTHPIIAAIYDRSLSGNFPGKIRNGDMSAHVVLAEIYLQHEIAEDAKSNLSNSNNVNNKMRKVSNT